MAPRLSGSRGKFDLGHSAAINITPLVGVMLLLLLVFMTAAPTPPRSITINNPPGIWDWFGSSSPSNKQVLINVEEGGKLYIGNRPTSLDTLVRDVGIVTAGRRPPDKYVMIRADRFVPYGDFMEAMSTLKAAGYKVGMVMEDL